MSKPPAVPDIDRLSDKELKGLVVALLGQVAALEEKVAAQAEEIARLKGLKGKPRIKPSTPSGMDEAAAKRAAREWRKRRRRGAKKPSAPVEERVIAASDIPPGSRFKGYESFTIQDLKIEARVVCYRRERWLDCGAASRGDWRSLRCRGQTLHPGPVSPGADDGAAAG